MNDTDVADLLFDPSLSGNNWESWGLFLLLIAYAVGAYIYVDREMKRRSQHPTHRYNRKTRKVEPTDE